MRWGRLLITGILGAYSLFVILNTEGNKETELEAKIRQIEGQLRDTSPDNSDVDKLNAELIRLKDSRLDRDSAILEQQKLKEKLTSLPVDSEEYNNTLRSLSSVERQIPRWYDRFPLNLGLDLRGGTEVRLRIINERQQHVVQTLTEKLASLTPDTEEYKEVSLKLSDAKDLLNTNINNAVEVIRKRLNRQGLANIPVSKEGANRIRVQLPGMDSERAKGIINSIKTAGQLEFRIVTDQQDNPNEYMQFQNMNLPPNTTNISKILGRKLLPAEIDENRLGKLHGERLYDWLEIPAVLPNGGATKKPAELLLVKQDPKALTGEHITRASYSFDQGQRSYEVLINFDREGSLRFGRLTNENIKRRLGIIIDNRLVSAPTIQDAIYGTCRITGNFTQPEAEQLAVILQDGSLPVELQVEMENTVGPTLGEDSIRRGMEAIVFGFVLVLAFMFVYYLVAGVVTNVALAFNMIFILAILIGADATLTLPGIAGLILTIGMAVDANVLIFERVREELKKGNTLISSINIGYEKAFVTIVDANITTLLTALILNEFGTEIVKGFAITLMIGILTSMFVSVFITRAFFNLLLDAKWINTLKMCTIIKPSTIDFVKLCKPLSILSLIVIVVGMAVFVFRGERNYSNDLTSGTLAHFNLKKALPITEARKQLDILRQKGFNDVSLQSFGTDEREYVIRTKLVNPEGQSIQEGEVSPSGEALKAAIAAAFPLEDNGISNIQLLEHSVDAFSEFEFTLTLRQAQSPASIQGLLAKNTELNSVRVRALGAERPNRHAKTALVTFGLRASITKDKDLAAITLLLRDSISKLKQSLIDPSTGINNVVLSESKDGDKAKQYVTATLSLKESATPNQLQQILAGSNDFLFLLVDMKAEVNPDLPATTDPVSQLAILCTISTEDAIGNRRTVQAQEQVILSELGALRITGRIDYTDPFSRFASVGPLVASEMKRDAIVALFYSMIVIFFYIWFRFQFRSAFSIGACIALLHDVLFTVGILAIADEILLFTGEGVGTRFQVDVTIIAALLTIVGYSLNDTIVIFDRIRENLAGGTSSMREIINRSINQTLSRTLLTSLTTLLVVIALLILGGEVIRGFAFCLFVGISVGTYSSICIAAPVLIYMENYAKRRSNAKKTAITSTSN